MEKDYWYDYLSLIDEHTWTWRLAGITITFYGSPHINSLICTHSNLLNLFITIIIFILVLVFLFKCINSPNYILLSSPLILIGLSREKESLPRPCSSVRSRLYLRYKKNPKINPRMMMPETTPIATPTAAGADISPKGLVLEVVVEGWGEGERRGEKVMVLEVFDISNTW